MIVVVTYTILNTIQPNTVHLSVYVTPDWWQCSQASHIVIMCAQVVSLYGDTNEKDTDPAAVNKQSLLKELLDEIGVLI